MINENDSVATDELRYGTMTASARVAQMIKADLCCSSPTSTACTRRSGADPIAEHIAQIGEVTDAVAATGPASGSIGRDALRWSRRIASGAGCATLIASGREDHPIDALAKGARDPNPRQGLPRAPTSNGSRHAEPAGSLAVDAGGQRAGRRQRACRPESPRSPAFSVASASPSSIRTGELARISVTGRSPGNCRLMPPAGSIIARPWRPRRLIHRDDLVMLAR